MKPGGLLGWLMRTPVIVGFLIATLLVGFGFYFVQQASGGPLLDTILSGDDAIIRLAEMTADQRLAHFRGTVLLDTLYPITYFGFIGGLSARLAGRAQLVVLLPVGFTAIVDYIENTVQAMALAGQPAEVLLVKDIVTPLKTGGLISAIILMFILITIAVVRRLRAPREKAND